LLGQVLIGGYFYADVGGVGGLGRLDAAGEAAMPKLDQRALIEAEPGDSTFAGRVNNGLGRGAEHVALGYAAYLLDFVCQLESQGCAFSKRFGYVGGEAGAHLGGF